MKSALSIAAILLLSSTQSLAYRHIDVVLIFGFDNALSTQERIDEAIEYETYLNSALTNSGINPTEKKFRVNAHVSGTFAIPQTGKAEDILSWVNNQHADPTSQLRLARDHQFGNNNGADLVLVSSASALTYDGDFACGGAHRNPITISVNNRNTHFAAVVTKSTAGDCESVTHISIPHEIGHLMGAEHETSYPDQYPDLPKKYNHGYFDVDLDVQTIMHSNVIPNATANTFSGAAPYTDDLTHSDVRLLISAVSWEPISLYRRPLPTQPSLSALFLGCHATGCASWQFNFSSEHANLYRIESRSQYGNWVHRKTTTSTSWIGNFAQNNSYIRVRGENETGAGSWAVDYLPGQCGGGPGDIEQFDEIDQTGLGLNPAHTQYSTIAAKAALTK